MKYLLDELNKEYQHKIPYIPAGTYETALYDYSIQSEEDSNMYISSGYNGYKNLTFYGKPPKKGYYFEGEKLGEIDFPNFKMAYEFILANNLTNYNIRCGCYKEEIKQYEKEKRKIPAWQL